MDCFFDCFKSTFAESWVFFGLQKPSRDGICTSKRRRRKRLQKVKLKTVLVDPQKSHSSKNWTAQVLKIENKKKLKVLLLNCHTLPLALRPLGGREGGSVNTKRLNFPFLGSSKCFQIKSRRLKRGRKRKKLKRSATPECLGAKKNFYVVVPSKFLIFICIFFRTIL